MGIGCFLGERKLWIGGVEERENEICVYVRIIKRRV